MTSFALIAGAAQLVFVYNFVSSIFYGKKGPKNPWKSNTLEWTAEMKHIHGNWDGPIPEVHRWAYDYSKVDDNDEYVIPGQDYIPQTVPLQKDEEELNH